MLHNGVDPMKREGMTVGPMRREGLTPLESFRNEIRDSPWRDHSDIGPKFYKMSEEVHKILEQGEQAMKLKDLGNKAFGDGRYEDALKSYADARKVWATANIRGHHVATLWSNEAQARKRLEQWAECREACEEGLTHFCTERLRGKLQDTLETAKQEMENAAQGVVKEKPPKPEVVRKPPTPLKQGWVQETSTKPLYPKGSVQGKVEKPGPFICPFNEASENGFVDGVDGWKDRQKREEQALDRELVAQGFMSPDLLDDPKTIDYINRMPPGADC
mmetsp:Transcript_42931/g.119399  ORF Transcript_42931/g.119399 Transcript_42931/m.119399 type:complete len:275 (+) Transcript_42931:3-827(+)